VLDGIHDLGVGILFGFTRDGVERRHMVAAILAGLGRKRDVAGGLGVRVLFAAFPIVYSLLPLGVLTYRSASC